MKRLLVSIMSLILVFGSANIACASDSVSEKAAIESASGTGASSEAPSDVVSEGASKASSKDSSEGASKASSSEETEDDAGKADSKSVSRDAAEENEGSRAGSQSFEQGSKEKINDVSVVNLRGSWYEMGRQYGALMKDELGEVHYFVETIIEHSIGNAEKADSIVAVQTAQTPYRISEFMKGASETSGLTVEQLQEVNAVERIGGLPKCSAAICSGEYAAGPLVIGRNYDYSDAFALLKDDVAVTVYHPSDGSLAVATMGYVGEIYAVNGLNEKGIFMELNNGKPSANIKSPDARVTGTTMLFSALFEIDELEDWDLFFNTVNCSSSYIINVADDKKACSYEWCPVGVKKGGTDLPEGLLVSTNYYVNPDWLFRTPSDKASWEGITRRKNLINLCEAAKGKVDDTKMREIIGTSMEDGGAMNELTVFQMVVVPETKQLWIRVIGGAGWTQVDLSKLLQQP